jgi:hypothetical protein
VSGWRLAPLRRLRALEARTAARALGAALSEEADAALEVARRLRAAEAAAQPHHGFPGASGALPAAGLAGAAACAERHAAGLLEARAVARRAAAAAAGERLRLLAARAADGLLLRLEARWFQARRRERLRAEEAELDDRWRRADEDAG